MNRNKLFRIGLFLSAVVILGLVYLFQQFNFLQAALALVNIPLSDVHPYSFFVVNKTMRLILNDLACFMIIVALFQERKYLTVTWYVFLIELLVVLPLYFAVKLSIEGDSELSSPLLSQIHRLIVNPVLMILLIIGFFYQRLKKHNA